MDICHGARGSGNAYPGCGIVLVFPRLKPLSAPFLQRLIGPDHPETDVLQPAETVSVPKTAFIPGMLDRVTAADEYSTLDFHLHTALSTVARHEPVLRRVWRNALVRRRGYATWRRRERYERRVALGELVEPVERLPLVRYCHSWASWRYFGHWLIDSLPTAMIEPDLGALWMPYASGWAHPPQYLDALALPAVPDHTILAQELVTYQDFSQGSHKIARYNRIRDQLQARFGGGPSAAVYLRRAKTGARRAIANEDALVAALQAQGWLIVDTATASVDALQRALCAASIVVSIDGSHLEHAQLSVLPGRTLVLLVPHDRFTLQHVALAHAHGVKPGFVVLNGSQEAGYIADLDEILRTVDLAAATA